MILRKTQENEITRVMEIINQAKTYFQNNGINQWQDGYPNEESIQQDIINNEAFVLEDDHQIIGTCMITTKGEPTYRIIDGKWLTDGDYLCVHRIALDNQYKGTGLAGIMLNQAIEMFPQCHSLRMDTHEDNLSMQRFLIKYGFQFCGIITLENGDLRRAYEKIL